MYFNLLKIQQKPGEDNWIKILEPLNSDHLYKNESQFVVCSILVSIGVSFNKMDLLPCVYSHALRRNNNHK
jgi:hypothetical protein